MANETQHEALIHDYYTRGMAQVAQGNVDVLDDFYQQDYVDQTPHFHIEGGTGLAGLKKGLYENSQRMTGVEFVPQLIVARDDMVLAWWAVRAVHTTPHPVRHVGDADAVGHPMEFSGVNIYRMRDGKIAESWEYDDNYEVLLRSGMVQMNAAPGPLGG